MKGHYYTNPSTHIQKWSPDMQAIQISPNFLLDFDAGTDHAHPDIDLTRMFLIPIWIPSYLASMQFLSCAVHL